jgi:hypothetical protein
MSALVPYRQGIATTVGRHCCPSACTSPNFGSHPCAILRICAYPAIFAALDRAESVLIAGAGGGFDVFAGLPLALTLLLEQKRVHLANLSFSELHSLDHSVWLEPNVAVVTESTPGLADYFPERVLASWLASQNLPSTVYAFPLVGVQPLRTAYRALVDHLGVDAVVLVDGGTDILLCGDESDLGTPRSTWPGWRTGTSTSIGWSRHSGYGRCGRGSSSSGPRCRPGFRGPSRTDRSG